MIRNITQLDPKRLQLFNQAMDDMDTRWDEAADFLLRMRNGQMAHPTRETGFYAIGLLLRDGPGDRERANRAILSILSKQFIGEGEVFHGTFGTTAEQPQPAGGRYDWKSMSLDTRYAIDTFYERIANAFRKRLQTDPLLSPCSAEIEKQLQLGLLDEYPVVYVSYDACWREFILSGLAVMLLFFEDRLPAETVRKMDAAARHGIQGSIERAVSRFAPLNTNIQTMHIFITDYFGARWQDEQVSAHARQYAADMLRDYRVHHAVGEFNSPTYNGVVLTYLGLLQLYGSCDEIRSFGYDLEAGLWEDLAEFYNPAMKNICGPYSRAYELELTVHSALPSILYMAGLWDGLPPVSAETESNPVLVLSQVTVPEHVKLLLLQSRGERRILRQFEELSERGDPRRNHALCTCTGWITDEMMLGGMRGSENPSYQLHPAVAFWRNDTGSLSTIKLLRRSREGIMRHVHTVYFDWTAEPNHLYGTVRNACGRDMTAYFEIESPGLANALLTGSCWQVAGLHTEVRALHTIDGRTTPAEYTLQPVSETIVQVCYPIEDGAVLDIDLRLTLEKAEAND